MVKIKIGLLFFFSLLLLSVFFSTKSLAQGTCECNSWCSYDLADDPNCEAGYSAYCFDPESEFDPCDCLCVPQCTCDPNSLGCSITDTCGSGYVESCGTDGQCGNENDCSCIPATPTPTPQPGGCDCIASGDECVYSTAYRECNTGYVGSCNGTPDSCWCVCVTPTPATYDCGEFAKPCCPGPTYCSSGLTCNTNVNLCLSSDTSCTCTSDYSQCLIDNECGDGYQEVCLYEDEGCYDSNGDIFTGCQCIVDYFSNDEGFDCAEGSLYNCQETDGYCLPDNCPSGCTCFQSQCTLSSDCVNTDGCADCDGDGNPDWVGGVTITPRPALNPLCGDTGINTAVGCIPLGDRNAFLSFILRWALGISGGVSFLFIVYSGFIIMTAAGDKRKTQAGKEILTAALSGILLIIFSVFLLDFVGIRILRIPGL